MQKPEHMGITINSTFTPSTNVLTSANKARGMLFIIKKTIYRFDEGDHILNAPFKQIAFTSNRIKKTPRKNTRGSNKEASLMKKKTIKI